MDLVKNDIEMIRSARILCLQHRFNEAISVAHKVQDLDSRNTLLFICRSFLQAQINVKVA